jgi:hypothetical protein
VICLQDLLCDRIIIHTVMGKIGIHMHWYW